MKRIISFLLVGMFILTGCSTNINHEQLKEDIGSSVGKDTTTQSSENDILDIKNTENIVLDENIFVDSDDTPNEFASLSDPNLLQYVKDDMYSDLVDYFDSEDYVIENVNAVYVSEEYLEEVDFNAKPNIYFGYTLEQLDSQFQGARYIFSYGENGETVVEEFAAYDDTYERIIKNVAIGTGLILVCVTVSVISGGVGAPPAVSMVFASAAKTGATYALESSIFSSIVAGTITGFKTGNFDEVKKAAALAGSEGFKWGAISGVISGGASKALELYRSANTIPTPRESELTVLNRTKNSTEQVSYLNGKEVPYHTPGSTRPDVIIKNINGTVQAIEVKNYSLSNFSNLKSLIRELKRQVLDRLVNLPSGSTQKIILDVRGRGYSKFQIDSYIAIIRKSLEKIDPNIIIEAMRY